MSKQLASICGRMYGMNRQVWKLEEYGFPFDPYQNSPVSPNGGSVMAGSAILSSSDNGYPISVLSVALELHLSPGILLKVPEV
jgi:hypothetical protein